ncbi:TetR family transcriptional regulator [Mycobacterium sp.]|uniref:TetR family transcriptional regulator n=1 Tax=Mycobacterium sp. TaxID=1785 RepID=UPI003D12E97E
MAESSAAMESASSNARGAKAKRRPRGSLDLEEIITGAFELAEEVSIAGLSMPVLAKHLDVPVTSIYWHFRRKDQLLDAMTERATRQYHFTNPFVDGGTWQDALRNHFRKMHLVFRENPVLCELVLMRTGELSPEATHTSVNNLETVIRTMVDAGFSPDDALSIYLALSAHSRGTSMIEQLNAGQRPRGIRPPTGVRTDHPLLYELEYRGHSIDQLEFEFTLDAIIARAEDILAHSGRKRRSRSK